MGHAEPRNDHGMLSMGTLVDFNFTTPFAHSTSASGATSGGTRGGISIVSQDSVSFGAGGLSNDESMQIVFERAMEKLRGVVDAARAELGFPEGAAIDTSPEATAGRIVDFALGNFGHFYDNHPELSEDEARVQFADFIGDAINQGIQEASDILTALNALNPDVESMIETISGIINERLAAFAQGDA